jgi:glutamyl-tRNA(Gln) amidotransferase subunit D
MSNLLKAALHVRSMDIPAFSRVRLTWKGRRLEGILTPGTDTMRLKLDSGYNIGLETSEVSEVEILAPPPNRPVTQASKKAKGGILLIHTGGTIASKVDYASGAVYPSFSSEELLASYPELEEFSPIETIMLANIVSEDLRFSHMNAIAKAIHERRDDPTIKGFIVTHGTDTMHYTAAALSFILGSLEKPVILVGAQRSSDRPSSDARLNLLSAVLALHSAPPAVYVCMHGSVHDERCVLILGVSARKMHSSRRDAFASINRPPVGFVDFAHRIVDIEPFELPASEPRFEPLDESLRIGVLVSRPNLFARDVEAYGSYDGLIVEGSGFGHLPASKEADPENERVLKSIERIAQKIPVFMTRRTISGVTNLNVYTPGRKLREAGVLGHGCDSTPETAYVKLAWALSNHKDDVARIMEENIAAEHSAARDIE